MTVSLDGFDPVTETVLVATSTEDIVIDITLLSKDVSLSAPRYQIHAFGEVNGKISLFSFDGRLIHSWILEHASKEIVMQQVWGHMNNSAKPGLVTWQNNGVRCTEQVVPVGR